MKRFVAFVFCSLLTVSSCQKDTIVKYENPITGIRLNHSADITLEVGDSFSIDCDVSPVTTDQPLDISVSDTSVIELEDNLIYAKSPGITSVDIRPRNSAKEALKKTLNITVISKIDQSAYRAKNGARVQQSTFQLCISCYDGLDKKNRKVNEVIYSEPAIIVRQVGTKVYYLAHTNVAKKAGTTNYWKMYLLAPDGTEYALNHDGKMMTETRLLIGSFDCDKTLFPAIVAADSFSEERIAVYDGSQFLFSYLKSKGTERFDSKTSWRKSFYAEFTSLSPSLIGAAVYNKDGDVIGIIDSYSDSTITAIDVSLIREAIGRIIDNIPTIVSGHIDGIAGIN